MSKGASTKKALIEQAIQLFSKNGYENTSFQNLADKMHISQAAVFYHFKSKRGLFQEVIVFIRERLKNITENMFKPSDNALIRLEKYFIGNLNWALIYRKEAEIVLLLHHFASNNQIFRQTMVEHMTYQRETIEEILMAGQREGIFNFEESPIELSSILLDFLTGIMITYLSGGAEITKTKSIKQRVNYILKSHLKIKQ